MYQHAIVIVLISLLTACIYPIRSSCTQDESNKAPNAGQPVTEKSCNEVDAALYLASALYMQAQKQPTKEKTISDPNAKNSKCSGLVGKAQKECQRKERDAYEPLDEL